MLCRRLVRRSCGDFVSFWSEEGKEGLGGGWERLEGG